MSMTTELAQRMKGQTVKAPYYLAECTHCGEMYPSNLLNGGEPLFAGDYNDCLCPHCNTDDSLIADLGAGEETAVAAWNFQQKRIDSLVEALEAALMRNAELERMESALRPVGVMSQKAYRQLENRESRFIALWPRPEIYLPRKRPDDGVIVFARTAACVAVEGE